MNNIYSAIPESLESELFDELISNDALKIERIVSQGQVSPEEGWYDQENNEWVIVLRGEAKLDFTDQPEIHLREGDFINIPAHTKHRVSWTPEDQLTIWLAIHY